MGTLRVIRPISAVYASAAPPIPEFVHDTQHIVTDAKAEQAARDIVLLRERAKEIQLDAERRIQEVKDSEATPRAVLKLYFEQNPQLAPGAKQSAERWGVRFGVRKAQATLELLAGQTWEKVLELIKRRPSLKGRGLITEPKPSVHRQHLKQVLSENPKLADDLQVKLIPGEYEFFAEPTE